MLVAPFKIENESEADDYLKDLLGDQKFRSMNEVDMRAKKLIKDESLRNYFTNKAKEILQTYGHDTAILRGD